MQTQTRGKKEEKKEEGEIRAGGEGANKCNKEKRESLV